MTLMWNNVYIVLACIFVIEVKTYTPLLHTISTRALIHFFIHENGCMLIFIKSVFIIKDITNN